MSKPMSAQGMSKMEEAKNVKDENKLYLHEGILYSTIMSPSENLEGLKKLEGRPDDILLVAYPKCGFNWMVAVLRKIMAAASGQQEVSQIPPLMEFFSPDMQKVVGEMPSPRLLGTHLHPDNIPGTFIARDEKTKMLVVFRNPKDTVVSYYHFMNTNPVLPNAKSWDSFFTDFMEGEGENLYLFLFYLYLTRQRSKVATVISLLTGRVWATAVWERGEEALASYEGFMALFRGIFDHPLEDREGSEAYFNYGRMIRLSREPQFQQCPLRPTRDPQEQRDSHVIFHLLGKCPPGFFESCGMHKVGCTSLNSTLFILQNLGQGVQQISKFFGFPLTEEQVQTIAGQSTFNAMKDSSKNTHGKHGNVFFRKGEVGDWKNHLSEAQSKQMDEKFEKHLAHTKLGAKLKYDIYCK
ncbi:sulfotransferase 6B1 [Salvelinus sp. IW2-2015]|uniref:sulfotransferase 6B1 n=1 Tax=Salvelinus sp. IW2-2015 TaxID=2691554 RepID=UPI0038D3F71A